MTPLPLTPRDRVSPARPQMSFPPSGGRGRSRAAARRAHAWVGMPARRRDEFLTSWSRLMIASFGSVSECAEWAGVSEPCVRNWLEGFHRPCGDIVAQAALTLPDFARIIGEG
ncbi:hypothetical protein SAMN04487971_109126 [Paracoccus chinensis]|uniref:Uncharacterized protein n=2 Tax=Paracoccus chinensis TaxID=525640 RepID=A0A1G9JGA0_9RHOB|nr:hypothetical protein SAMN04487971_109126 [Paracoccus chinensis]